MKSTIIEHDGLEGKIRMCTRCNLRVDEFGNPDASYYNKKFIENYYRIPVKERCPHNRTDRNPIGHITDDVLAELAKATSKYGPMLSAHEGYAVVLEEMDELWEEIKLKPSERSKDRMREEAIQLAAMAMRFIMDVCDTEEK